MRFENKFRICLLKGYFDFGLSLTNHIKYPLILFGIYEVGIRKSMTATLIAGITYGIACFFIGYFAYKYDWVRAINEVGNRFNLFQQEMRKAHKKRKV